MIVSISGVLIHYFCMEFTCKNMCDSVHIVDSFSPESQTLLDSGHLHDQV